MSKTKEIKNYITSNIIFSQEAQKRFRGDKVTPIRGVYSINCVDNGMIYVGSSPDIIYRLTSHILSMGVNTHIKPRMSSDFKKYGIQRFIFKVEHIIEDDSAMRMVEYAITEEIIPTGFSYNNRKPRKIKHG